MRALITASLSESVLAELKTLMEITYEPWRETKIVYFDVNELTEKLKEYEVFITEADDLKKSKIFEESKLKLVVSCRGDPFNVDLKTASMNNVPVLNTPLRNVDAVAELTIGLILSLARNLQKLDRLIHSESFEIIDFDDYLDCMNQYMGIELKGKTVGIIGFGQIGRRVATRLNPFGVKILVYDPYVSEEIVANFGKKVEIDEIVKDSDFITIHAVATDENDNLINEEIINSMKETAYIINTSKGSLIDYDALYNALKSKSIAGAALDVFPMEPIDEDNEFIELENVIITPHIGGNTKEVIKRQSEILLQDIKLWLDNKAPKHVLNPEVFKQYKQPENKAFENLRPLKQEIVDVCFKLLEEGHVIGSAGNVSVRTKVEDQDTVLITPSNFRYDEMNAEDILIINMDGKVLSGDRNPSVERHLHLGVYKEREDVQAIIHSHSVYSTILSTLNLTLPPIFEELVPYLGGEIVCADYGEAGSSELAENVVERLGEKNALFLANHGNLCCGSHLEGAYTVLTYLERGAKIYYLAKVLGNPTLLPEDTIEYEEEVFEIFKESKKI